jgi:hypothetical protein
MVKNTWGPTIISKMEQSRMDNDREWTALLFGDDEGDEDEDTELPPDHIQDDRSTDTVFELSGGTSEDSEGNTSPDEGTDNESEEAERVFAISAITARTTTNGIRYYRVVWEPTWEPEDRLREDGLGDALDELDERLNRRRMRGTAPDQAEKRRRIEQYRE